MLHKIGKNKKYAPKMIFSNEIFFYVLSMSYSIRRNFHRTSKFSSNLIVYLLFLFFAVSKKRRNRCGIFFFLITQPFLYLEGLEGALKLISQEQFKNTTTKIFQVLQQFRGSTKISTHRIWHGEHISLEEVNVCYIHDRLMIIPNLSNLNAFMVLSKLEAKAIYVLLPL